MKNIFLCLSLLLTYHLAISQSASESVYQSHFTADDILLNNMNIQIEVTDAVNYMYNFEFAKAAKEYKWLKYRFPKHPLPYFLLGLNEWWKAMPELDNNSTHDKKFLAYMDSAIYFSNILYKENDQNIEAAFFLSAAHAFKGRLYSERGSWTKAALEGKSAIKYLKISRENNELSPEFLFGDGIYNYYAEWIPENYPVLKPLMAMFDPGNKKLGKEQLTTVSRNAFYTRIEAQYFMVRILSVEENDPIGGLELAKYMYETYPNNAYFERFYARQLYVLGKYKDAEAVSLSMMSKIDSAKVGYGGTSGRYAAFFLGQIYEAYREYEKSLMYYERAIAFSEETKAQSMGYNLYALLNTGQLYEKLEMPDKAKEAYKKVIKHSKKKQNANEQARKRLKAL